MTEWPLGILLVALFVLLILSGLFSGSETGLMAINRYRLRHRARQGDPAARRVLKLLERPDRLIGVILLGNNFINVLASALATIIALRLGGEAGLAIGTVLLTIFLLIFGEVTPKTLAAMHPERIAYPASRLMQALLWLFYPLVWLINAIANALLQLFGVSRQNNDGQSLSPEELRSVVLEAGGMIPRRHQNMLLSILDLEAATVEDIMVPRNEVVGIDLAAEWARMLDRLSQTPYTRLPVFRENLDHVMGYLHMRRLVGHFEQASPELIGQLVVEPLFVPEGTSLQKLLVNFQQHRQRIGLVVDEYGDVIGLVTLEDLLEEIVGEFTTDPAPADIARQSDGSYLVNGRITIRTLNRALDWSLPTDGPKTLGGLILEYMEAIPNPGTCLLLGDYPVEVVEINGNRIHTVRMQGRLKRRKRRR